MSPDSHVDVNKQTIRAIIPGLDVKAAKRINKFRQFTIIGFSIVIGVGFDGYGISHLLDQFNMVTAVIVVIIVAGVYLPIVAYLVRKWSIEWNKQFQSST